MQILNESKKPIVINFFLKPLKRNIHCFYRCYVLPFSSRQKNIQFFKIKSALPLILSLIKHNKKVNEGDIK